MTDFGLGDDIIQEKKLLKMLKWHNLLLDTEQEVRYNCTGRRAGNPSVPCNQEKTNDGMVSDSVKHP